VLATFGAKPAGRPGAFGTCTFFGFFGDDQEKLICRI